MLEDEQKRQERQTDRQTQTEREWAAFDGEEDKKEKKRKWNRSALLYMILAAHCLISYRLFVSSSRKKASPFRPPDGRKNRLYRSNSTATLKTLFEAAYSLYY